MEKRSGGSLLLFNKKGHTHLSGKREKEKAPRRKIGYCHRQEKGGSKTKKKKTPAVLLHSRKGRMPNEPRG